MTWTTEKTAIEGKFSAWTATPIKWPNRPFKEPASPYLAVHILNGEAQEATIGPPVLRRHIGVVAVMIFDKENQGEDTIRALSDQVENLFIGANSRLTISATEWIDFGQPSLTPVQAQHGWHHRNVHVHFARNEVKS